MNVIETSSTVIFFKIFVLIPKTNQKYDQKEKGKLMENQKVNHLFVDVDCSLYDRYDVKKGGNVWCFVWKLC